MMHRSLLLAALVLATGRSYAQTPTPPEALHDAELTSVQFIDADTGWAAGDRGVIWHTIDGGRHWQRQDSPTRSRLESVWFVDPENGWTVGGHHQPYTHRSAGVVLRTVDGGKTWQNTAGLNLPALRYVKFFSPRQGIAVGNSSAMYPGGIFTTSDGGRSWASLPIIEPSPSDGGRRWVAGDFLGMQGGMVAAADGTIGSVAGLQIRINSPVAGAPFHHIRISRDAVAWLSGAANSLARSSDGGATWHSVSPAPQSAGKFDLAALSTVARHCWTAGNPGSLVFQTADEGKTWEAHPTGVNVPLNSLCFLDEHRGWAVGALGTILATRDGGRSWRVQRQGGARTAMLAIFSQAERIPMEMVVQQAGNEGYLTAMEVLTHAPSDAGQAARLQQASSTLLASHASIATAFPLDQIKAGGTLEEIVGSWGPGAAQALEEYVVRRIRTWRPDVIVTEDAHPRGDDPLAHLTNQVVLAAAVKAADPSAYPHHITEQGLPAWKVSKVFAALSRERQGDITLVCSQLAPRLGASLAEVADEARSQIEDEYILGPSARGFRLLLDHLPQGQGKRDFFSGLALAPGSEARRVLSNPPVPDLTALTRQIQKRQALQEILERGDKEPLRGTAWLAQVSEMTKGLPPAATGRVLHHLALRYHVSGESELAAQVLQLLVERQPDHPLSDASLPWLMNYHSSEELAHRLPPKKVVERVQEGAIALVSAQSDVPVERSRRAIACGKLLERNRPALFAEPSVRYAMAAATRRQSQAAAGEGQRLLQSLASSPASGVWSDCAQAELWLAGEVRGACPKPRMVCRQCEVKPRLDGRLDDAVWQSAQSVPLRDSGSGEQTPSAIVALAHDGQYLYLAVSCQRAAGADYAPEKNVRQRDADLSKHDRVDILLDINRDYASYYRLTVDARGWTNDSCFGDPTWDPAWYVAASGDASYWTVEAAVPLAELTSTQALKGSAWAIGLQRAVPMAGVQSWSKPADLEVIPAGFGLLQFD